MLIVIIVKKALRSAFSDVKVCAAGAGIMGVMASFLANSLSEPI